MKLVFGDFLPDLPSHGTPGVTEAVNLYPTSGGYRPVGQWVAHTNALPAPCRGSSAFVAPSGRVVVNGLEESLTRVLNTGCWSQVSSFGAAVSDFSAEGDPQAFDVLHQGRKIADATPREAAPRWPR